VNNATMVAIVGNLADGLSYKQASISAGVNVRTFWRAIKASQEGNPEYMVRYLDQDMTFAEAAGTARRIHSMSVRSQFESYCLLGFEEPVVFNGQIQWQVDRRTVGWSEDEREAYGFERDGYLRNSAGETLPLTVTRKPSDAAVLRFLEMAHPDEYRPTTNQNITTTNIKAPTQGAIRASDMGDGPPPVPPRPPIPELQVLPDPVDEELEDMLTGSPEQPEQPDEIEPALEPQPTERVISEAPPPPEYSPPPQTGPLAPPAPSNISPELRALLNRTPKCDLERDLISKAVTQAQGTPK
jgi:hypothetical protein